MLIGPCVLTSCHGDDLVVPPPPPPMQLKVKGFISGTPQLRSRWVNNGEQQHYGSVLVRDSMPKGFTILCLFVSPLWDVVRIPHTPLLVLASYTRTC